MKTGVVRCCWVLGMTLLLSACGGADQKTYSPVPSVAPKSLCIFYGQPFEVNAATAGQTQTAVTAFSSCALVVLGDGLLNSSAANYADNMAVINGLRQLSIPLYGYVDLGVTTQNLTLSAVQGKIDQWKQLGAGGIFLDDFGYDFGTPRIRQNAALDAVHSQGLFAFVNAFSPDDVFGAYDETGSILAPKIASNDLYLAENWLYANDQYQSMSLWATKTQKLVGYLASYHVKLAVTATRASQQATVYDATLPAWQQAYWGSVLQNADYFQWTENDFGSSNNSLYTYATPSSFVNNASFTSALVATKDNATGLAAYARSTSYGALSIYGDSATTGGARVSKY